MLPVYWNRARILVAIILALGTSAASFAVPPPGKAGEITLVLGRANITDSDGQSSQLVRGALVFVGDRIETASNGHVHVRFVDQALLSVRPNSVLEVESYEFDPANPRDSSIKINLEEGVARAISGEASKAARERFRLNTPVAAIGVRGTDFVVGAYSESTRVKVNEGAVVIAPFSSTCSISDFGPCSDGGLELVRDRAGLAFLESGDAMPRLISSGAIRGRGDLQRQIQSISGPSQESSSLTRNSDEVDSASNPLNNGAFLEAVASPSVRLGAEVAAAKVSSTDFIPTEPITVSAGGQIEQFDHTPPSKMTKSMLDGRQLVWGYYGDSPGAIDRLALSFNEASDARRISVGSAGFGLFRRDASANRVDPELTVVGFQLTSAQAVFNSETGVIALRTDSGRLDVDFQNNTFDTMLSLGHESMGQFEFSAVGRIFDGGFLRAIGGTQKLTGAVSFDGSEAGYLFEKQFNSGLLTGLTLWDSK